MIDHLSAYEPLAECLTAQGLDVATIKAAVDPFNLLNPGKSI